MTDSSKLKTRVSTLSRLLDDLESQLDPLLAQSLPETLLPLTTIQQAKIQVTVPYLVYDLIIIYLKTKGIDPKSHPVFTELNRVRQYIEKISNAENPETRKTAVDKAAATRFIKHAIAQAQNQQQPPQGTNMSTTVQPTAGPSSNSGPSTSIPAKMTSKMLARAQYEKELKELPSDEDEDNLEVFDSDDNDSGAHRPDSKGKGKALDVLQADGDPSRQAGKKRRRPPTDFSGDQDTRPAQEISSKSKKRKNEERSQAQDVSTDSSTKTRKGKKPHKTRGKTSPNTT